MIKPAPLLAYGNAAVMAMATIVLVLLPLHGIVVIGQLIAAICGTTLTVLLAVAAHRIDRSENAGRSDTR
jgi:hypothetical protein